ncbi:MAG: phosphoenolpyruvate carboxylase [Rhodobacteraceae bacterium]|nr:phosphoenolpyruvate carboxylase [Paracoccaceae bacterium]
MSRRWSSGSSRPPAAVSARCRRSPPCIKFHSWIGGDRDGNPNVTARATAEAVQRSRQAVLEKYLTGIRAAAARLGWTG